MPEPLLFCKLVERACRKFCRVAELPVSPIALNILVKSVCRVESAVLIALDAAVLELADDVPELEEASCEIRPFRLDSKPAGPPLIPDVDAVPALLLSLLLPLCCACRAEIRLCRKVPTAESALCVEDDDVEVAEDDELAADVLDPD